ncbi:hypothetical protein GIB67_021244 [Kingdonia uniflora]|uniref:Uncharacterized protein n=1 Tax=Kingdonia uniflora TaxID=39325 RepID=A0A7J7LFU5_9MAGN|nr:hypothetical protein GIB67_021244 [Kingdonia uniflora]
MVIFSCIVIASGIVVFKLDFHWCRLWGDPNEVHSFYSFQPSTVYFFVNYMDKFLSTRCLPVRNQWVAITTPICCLLVIGCKDGGTPCSISFGYTGRKCEVHLPTKDSLPNGDSRFNYFELKTKIHNPFSLHRLLRKQSQFNRGICRISCHKSNPNYACFSKK